MSQSALCNGVMTLFKCLSLGKIGITLPESLLELWNAMSIAGLSSLEMLQRSIMDSYREVGRRKYDKRVWQRDTSSLKIVTNNN